MQLYFCVFCNNIFFIGEPFLIFFLLVRLYMWSHLNLIKICTGSFDFNQAIEVRYTIFIQKYFSFLYFH